MTTLPIGRVIPSNHLHRALSENGYGCLVVIRGEYVEYAKYWPNPQPSTCPCTDGRRNNPLLGCPECGGTGEL